MPTICRVKGYYLTAGNATPNWCAIPLSDEHGKQVIKPLDFFASIGFHFISR
jgi:hypothetical protein